MSVTVRSQKMVVLKRIQNTTDATVMQIYQLCFKIQVKPLNPIYFLIFYLTGLITNSTALPVTQLFFGGLQYEAQQASFQLGRLKCYGKQMLKILNHSLIKYWMRNNHMTKYSSFSFGSQKLSND